MLINAEKGMNQNEYLHNTRAEFDRSRIVMNKAQKAMLFAAEMKPGLRCRNPDETNARSVPLQMIKARTALAWECSFCS